MFIPFRDSSCACFSINGSPRFGRILNFFIVQVAARVNRPFTEYLFAEVVLYKTLNIVGCQRNFRDNIILKRAQGGRREKKILELRNIKFKCIFLSCEHFDTLCRRNVYICSTLLNHVINLIENVP